MGSEHWRDVYRTKPADGVSWYRPHLDMSLRLLEGAGLGPQSRVIDVGGGASTLVDDLLARGVGEVTVLDLADEALAIARERLGPRGPAVHWLAADVTRAGLPEAGYDLWHDRAVLHFLVDPEAAAAYVAQVRRALVPGGHVVIGGFAPGGPERCSGLPVARRSPADVAALFGPDFSLVGEAGEDHQTPTGSIQAFSWAVLRKQL
ncbi:class I SAM-dependent methyltransferase [Arenimonas sp.]|uniref:class I SAM-dependent methyltransferase n=1 Tax=Arenimonas sp. TaxID=1872635 RepID=UPI0035AFB5B2